MECHVSHLSEWWFLGELRFLLLVGERINLEIGIPFQHWYHLWTDQTDPYNFDVQTYTWKPWSLPFSPCEDWNTGLLLFHWWWSVIGFEGPFMLKVEKYLYNKSAVGMWMNLIRRSYWVFSLSLSVCVSICVRAGGRVCYVLLFMSCCLSLCA